MTLGQWEKVVALIATGCLVNLQNLKRFFENIGSMDQGAIEKNFLHFCHTFSRMHYTINQTRCTLKPPSSSFTNRK